MIDKVNQAFGRLLKNEVQSRIPDLSDALILTRWADDEIDRAAFSVIVTPQEQFIDESGAPIAYDFTLEVALDAPEGDVSVLSWMEAILVISDALSPDVACRYLDEITACRYRYEFLGETEARIDGVRRVAGFHCTLLIHNR